ncbi:MAG: hypothetical protein AB1801_11565 [Chloroflexota bacterium]
MPIPTWLAIAKGPVFRFALAILILGLARLILLSMWEMMTAVYRAGDRRVSYLRAIKETLSWFSPLQRVHRTRPFYTLAILAFHLGVICSGLFLPSHIAFVESVTGFTWPAMPRFLLNCFTLIAIFAGAFLILYRLYSRRARARSKIMDYLLPLFVLNLLISGFIAGRPGNPIPYHQLMLFHTINGIILLVLIPYTKIAHCVLLPLLRLVSEIAWHLRPQGGTDVIKTLYGPEGRRL